MSERNMETHRPVRLVAMKRRNDMDRAMFSKHWRDVHGPLMASVSGISYVQNHVLEGTDRFGTTSSAAGIDGFAWIDIPASPTTPTATLQGGASAAGQDLPNFVGASTRMICQPDDVILIPRAGSWAKIVVVVRHRDSEMPPRDSSAFIQEYVTTLAEIPGIIGFRNNVVTSVLPLTDSRIADAGLNAAAILEFWFTRSNTQPVADVSPAWRRMQEICVRHGYDAIWYPVDEIVIA